MQILLLDDNEEVRGEITQLLQNGAEAKVEVFDDVNAAVARANEMASLDGLVARTKLGNGGSGIGLRNSLRVRFPKLRSAFIDDSPKEDVIAAVGDDPIFGGNDHEAQLLGWVMDRPMSTKGGADQVPTTLGDYRLSRLIADSPTILTFEATQMSVDRRVALKLLKPPVTEESLEEFLSLVRAQAAFVHQHVPPVYEALESEGYHFYTGELIPGRHLLEIAASGDKLGESQILNALRVAGEAMASMSSLGLNRRSLRASDILIDDNGATRLANIAIPRELTNTSEVRDIGTLVSNLRPLASPGMGEDLLAKLSDPEDSSGRSWEGLLSATKEARVALRQEHAAAISGNGLKAAGGGSRRTQMIIGVCVLAALLIAVILLGGLTFSKPPVRQLDEMVKVPAGPFLSGADKESVETEEYWIGVHEVTIAEYAAFMDALAVEGDSGAYDHPNQPSTKASGHLPDQWDELYAAAKSGRNFIGQPIDLNCPIVLVDWWDAYAYAEWKGHRLPSDEEWEKAARGRAGRKFPWGNGMVEGNANLGDDYSEDGDGGAIDGFSGWNPVDAVPDDSSPFSVVGTMGNVEEWTSSWVNHPSVPDMLVPSVRGGSFATPAADLDLLRRAVVDESTQRSPTRGFRTVSTKAPPSTAP